MICLSGEWFHMVKNKLEAGKKVPSSHHVARYCFPGTVFSIKGEDNRKVVTQRAFEWRGSRTADISFSVMERFRGKNNKEVIYKVCKHRGRLKVKEEGHYVKLNVGMIRSRRYGADRRKLRIIFWPKENPAHATLYTDGLMVSVELASLANERGEFFLVPSPVPEVVFSDCS